MTWSITWRDIWPGTGGHDCTRPQRQGCPALAPRKAGGWSVMPIAHVDVLLTVPPAEAPRWLVARARRIVPLAEASMPPATQEVP